MFALSCSNGPPFTEVPFGRDCSGRLALLAPDTGHVLTLGRGGRGGAGRGAQEHGSWLRALWRVASPLWASHCLLVDLMWGLAIAFTHLQWSEVQSDGKNYPNERESLSSGGEKKNCNTPRSEEIRLLEEERAVSYHPPSLASCSYLSFRNVWFSNH